MVVKLKAVNMFNVLIHAEARKWMQVECKTYFYAIILTIILISNTLPKILRCTAYYTFTVIE